MPATVNENENDDYTDDDVPSWLKDEEDEEDDDDDGEDEDSE